MNRSRVVDRQDIGANIDRHHELGAAKDHGLDLLLGKLSDQRLELALAVTHHATRGKRDFSSLSGLSATHYDLVAREGGAERARAMLTEAGLLPPDQPVFE